jgi:4-alpha-glucanotransferase
MNTPGTEKGNWTWRMSEPIPPRLIERLAEATEKTYRR